MITAIFTAKGTKLTIETSEQVQLEKMGDAKPVPLARGLNTAMVAPGVYRLVSTSEVRVAADSPDAHVMSTTNVKDGSFPDPPKAVVPNVDREALRSFLSVSAKSLAH